MPAPSPEPLRKCTLNLFDKDVEAMERRYGRGWTEKVRELVRSHLKRIVEIQEELENNHG